MATSMRTRSAMLALVVAVVLGLAAVPERAFADGEPDYLVLSSAGPSGAERAKCIKQGACRNVVLTCPDQCPKRSTLGAGKKACFIDCTKCETICKHRKPNCYGFGSVCYDPRLVGGDGRMFYFHGNADKDFCLVSDRNLHINGHFIGLRPEGRKRDFTWVQGLGFLFGSHSFSVGAKKVAVWDDAVDQFMFAYDGAVFDLEETVGATWTSPSADLKVERTYDRNVVEVTVDRLLTVLLAVVPITESENRVHSYQLPADDVFAHLDMQFKFYALSESVDGILGQTYKPNYVSAAKVGVKMPVLGGEDRFFASGLLAADCRASQFSSNEEESSSVDGATPELIQPFTAGCSSKITGGNGIMCRR